MASDPESAPILLDPNTVTRLEKKYYLMALVTLAVSDDPDGAPHPRELKFISQAARLLGARLKESDFKTYDLARIARAIERPQLREALFRDLVRLAEQDKRWSDEELQIIKYFGNRWNQPLPDIYGIDWTDVGLPDENELKRVSERRREALPRRPQLLAATRTKLRWQWVFAATGIFFTVQFAILLVVMMLPGDAFVEGGETLFRVIMWSVLLVPALFAGVIIGRWSPGRTMREPAVGVAIPILMPYLMLLVIAVRAGEHAELAMRPLLEGILFGLGLVGERDVFAMLRGDEGPSLTELILLSLVPCLSMYLSALVGARLGEKWQDSAEGRP